MDADALTQKKKEKVNMADSFDYPEYARNKKGQLKEWVAEPNPWIPAATVGLLTLLSGIEEAEGGGYGIDVRKIADAGLLGTQTYMQGNQNLQQQRKDYFDHKLRTQRSMLDSMKYQDEHAELEVMRERRKNVKENFPALLKSIYDSGIPAFQKKVDELQALFLASPEKGMVAAMNIISQIKSGGELKTTPILDAEGNPTGHSTIMVGGEYKTTVKTGTGTGSPEKLDKQTLDGVLFGATQPDSKITPKNYRKYWKMRQQLATTKGTIESGGKKTLAMFAGPLEAFPTPWEYGIAKGMTPDQMTKLGWKEDPTINQILAESQKQIGSEAAKSAYKFGQIVQSEVDMMELSKRYPDFDHTKTPPASAEAWTQFMLRGLSANPFTGAARTAESIYMGGAQGFAYLFSGATVRAEELTQFRMIMYPVPGDSSFDVQRKRQRRQRIMDLYNKISPENVRQVYDEVNAMSLEDGRGELKLDLDEEFAKNQKSLNPKIQTSPDNETKLAIQAGLSWDE